MLSTAELQTSPPCLAKRERERQTPHAASEMVGPAYHIILGPSDRFYTLERGPGSDTDTTISVIQVTCLWKAYTSTRLATILHLLTGHVLGGTMARAKTLDALQGEVVVSSTRPVCSSSTSQISPAYHFLDIHDLNLPWRRAGCSCWIPGFLG